MCVMIISRTESKLIEQAKAIKEKYNVKTRYLAFDFTKTGYDKAAFYSNLDVHIKEMDQGDDETVLRKLLSTDIL